MPFPYPVLILCIFLSGLCKGQLLPFDIVSSEYDDNGFPKNPKWGYQVKFGNDSVPGLAKLGVSKNYLEWFRGKNPCTHDSLYRDPKTFPGCGLGHVNWFPVTYENNIFWKDHAFDDDYNFKLTRNDKALYTNDNTTWVYAEFDSDETVDLWKKKNKDWWDYFHSSVDSDDASAGNSFNGKFAIATGLFGLDCSHGGESELHPVYIFALHLKDDSLDDTWAFFVRNWGNEGWCGTSQHYLQRQTLKLRIPKEGAKDLRYSNESKIHSSIKNYSFSTEVIEDSGAILTFNLPPPEMHGWVEGELHLKWITKMDIQNSERIMEQIKINSVPETNISPIIKLGKGKVLWFFKRVW